MDFELEPAKFYSCEEVAQYLGLETVTIRKHCREGTLPSVRLGEQGKFRIRGRDILALAYREGERKAREFATKMGWDTMPEEKTPEILKDIPEDIRGRIISMCKVGDIALEELTEAQVADLVDTLRPIIEEESWRKLELEDAEERARKAREQASEVQRRQTFDFVVAQKHGRREIEG